MNLAGTGIKAGISPIYLCAFRYFSINSDQRLEYWRLLIGSSKSLRTFNETKAQIFAVKKNAENDKLDRTTLVDVGIRG